MTGPSLDELGERICILGPSNAGKSTLAQAIGRQRQLPVVHLDQLYHLPNSDWVPRPTRDFWRLHDEAIAQERWVMDGNYSNCTPQRLARATGLILLELPTLTSLLRYLRRSWVERERAGALAGGRDSVKWDMLRHIAVVTPKNRPKRRAFYDNADLPKLLLATPRELQQFYEREGLMR